MSNYPRSRAHFPSHTSLPSLPSHELPDAQQPTQDIQSQITIFDPYSIEDPTQPIFEPLPDVQASFSEPTVRQIIQNSQQGRIPGIHKLQDPTQSFFGPQSDALTPKEANTQQPIQNIQSQALIPSSNTIEKQDHPLFEPMADIPSQLESNAQQPTQITWEHQEKQLQVPIHTFLDAQNHHQPLFAPLPDNMTALETQSNPRPNIETILQRTHSQVAYPSHQLESQKVSQPSIRRTKSKPTVSNKQRSKRQVRNKKTVRNPTTSLIKRTQSHQHQAVNQTEQVKERTNWPTSRAVGLPAVLQGQAFKASLRSVLARSSKPFKAPPPARTQSALQPRFPDRTEPCSIATSAPRCSGRNQAGSSAVHAMGSNGRIIPRSGLVPHGVPSLNQSTPNLERPLSHRNSNPPGLTIRKRPASCSALPSRKSSKEIRRKKRPCDSVDQAIAEGRKLTKEELRVLRNRQHALNSRERTKVKKRQYNEENAMLKERITQLESENERLRTMRKTLLETAPVQFRLKVQVRENPIPESGANQPGEQSEIQKREKEEVVEEVERRSSESQKRGRC